jgi:clan AA aspartic protease
MGIVYAEITIKNAGDLTAVQRELIREGEVRSIVVNALVDTGAGSLIINEEVRQKLGLKVEVVRQTTLADGSKQIYSQMEPVRVYWKNREMVCMPLLLPGADEVLLGAVPLEELDLIVDPKMGELIGRHGDEMLMILKKAG